MTAPRSPELPRVGAKKPLLLLTFSVGCVAIGT